MPPKQFTVPPVVFPSGPTTASPNPPPSTTTPPSSSSTTTTTPSTTTHNHPLHQRRVPTAPFQPPSTLPFMSFDISSATTATTSSTLPPPHLRPSLSSSSLFLDEPPLLEELEINPSLIYRKTLSLLNPLLSTPSLHLHSSDPDLSGPFLYYILFCLFQLLAGKVQFGVILGWIAISSLFLYSILNFLSSNNHHSSSNNLHLYRCFSVVGYCLLPIVVYSAASIFLPPLGTPGIVLASIFVIWAARVSSRLLAEDCDHRGLIAYPCFLIYTLFSMLVMF